MYPPAAHHAELQDELSGYQRRRGEYLGYRTELKALLNEQRELLRALPKRAEIPTFLANVHEQAELAGLEVLSVDIGQEVAQDLYIKIPVKMEVRGTYHQIARFFRNVGELPRIVNVENLSLGLDKDKVVGVDVQGATPPKLRARFVAATFRFNEKTPGGGGTMTAIRGRSRVGGSAWRWPRFGLFDAVTASRRRPTGRCSTRAPEADGVGAGAGGGASALGGRQARARTPRPPSDWRRCARRF